MPTTYKPKTYRPRITEQKFASMKDVLQMLKDKKVSQKTLSHILGVSSATVNRIQTSDTYMDYKQLIKVHNRARTMNKSQGLSTAEVSDTLANRPITHADLEDVVTAVLNGVQVMLNIAPPEAPSEQSNNKKRGFFKRG